MGEGEEMSGGVGWSGVHCRMNEEKRRARTHTFAITLLLSSHHRHLLRRAMPTGPVTYIDDAYSYLSSKDTLLARTPRP